MIIGALGIPGVRTPSGVTISKWEGEIYQEVVDGDKKYVGTHYSMHALHCLH